MGKLEDRVALIEERLGIDPDAIAADHDAAIARGVEANTVTDAVLEEPGGQDAGDDTADPALD